MYPTELSFILHNDDGCLSSAQNCSVNAGGTKKTTSQAAKYTPNFKNLIFKTFKNHGSFSFQFRWMHKEYESFCIVRYMQGLRGQNLGPLGNYQNFVQLSESMTAAIFTGCY